MPEIDHRVVILILFVVISGIKWLFEKIKSNGQQSDVNEQLEDIYDEFRDEIRRRQTQTTSAGPPPLHSPQPSAPPPIPQVIPQPVPQEPVYQAPTVDTQERFRRKVSKPQLNADEQAALARMNARMTRKKSRRSHGGSLSISAMLADPASARKAVVLQEILGKPRGMVG